MKRLKNIVFLIILLGLMLPLAQQGFKLFEQKPLHGAFTEPDTVEFNWKNWVSSDFQDRFSPYYEFQIGFRPFFIRVRNQLYYWLYHESTTYVVPGKESQLFSWDYWSAYRGFNYVGEDSMQVKIQNLAWLHDSLQKMGKPLLCVIAPNKVRYMPEMMPHHYSREPGETTNYNRAKALMDKYQIPVLDANQLFLQMKDTEQYPLFANTSIHWSGYGMNLGMKWMIDSLEKIGGQNLVNLRFDSWSLKDSAISSDRDMIDLMNLLFPYDTEPLAFADFAIQGQPGAQKARVLIIGDSFFWNYYAFDERHEIFHEDTRFWYYNNTQRDLHGNEQPVTELSARETIKDLDYVVILATESNMQKFPYGFPEKFLNE